MNKVNNKRKRTSQKRIQDAFLQLLETQNLAQITVTTICQVASINRSTFYANYIDREDLIETIQKDLEENYLMFHEKSLANQTTEPPLLALLKHVKSNQTLYNIYFKIGLDNQIDLSPFGQATNLQLDSELVESQQVFFRAGVNAVIKQWLTKGCIDSPRQLYRLIERQTIFGS